MAAIREKYGYSAEDIQQKTRLSPNIITSIEDDSIFEQLHRNKAYIRSYVRNYAKVLDIDDKRIVKALDQVELGAYDGQLNKSLNAKPKSEIKEGKDEEEVGFERLPVSSDDDDESLSQNKQKSLGEREVLDWSQFSHQSIPDGRHIKKRGVVIGGVIIIVLIIIGIFLFFYLKEDSKTLQNEPVTTVNSPQTPNDSLRTALLPQQEPAGATAIITLPDTLTMTIIAAKGKLEPVRVYTDIMKIRRPYWIENHDTLSFEFIDTFRIMANDQTDRMELVFNGHIIQDAYNRFFKAESGMIELSRSLIQDHPEWMAPGADNESL